MVRRFLEPLRSASRALSFAAWTSGVVNAHRLLGRVEPELRSVDGKGAFIARWSDGVFPIFGLDLTVVDGAALRGIDPYLVIANHRSPLDILICVHLVGGVVLSHHRVKAYPVIGDAAAYTDTIFVDRADSRSGAQAIRQMRRLLRAGRNVIVFPEGSTFDGDEVRPFKRGSFTAAKGLDVQVLPLGIAYERGAEFVNESFRRHLLRMCARPRTPIWVTIGEPRPVPRTDADAEAMRQYVQTLVDRAAAARDAEGQIGRAHV
jgi:lyso-ornithine lipid O-acyltransferase